MHKNAKQRRVKKCQLNSNMSQSRLSLTKIVTHAEIDDRNVLVLLL